MDFINGSLVQLWIPDNATFADVLTIKLKLGFDQTDDLAIGFQTREHWWEDFSKGDEGYIGNGEVNGVTDISWGHVARIEFFFDDNTRVIAQLPDELIGANIDGVNLSGAVLE